MISSNINALAEMGKEGLLLKYKATLNWQCNKILTDSMFELLSLLSARQLHKELKGEFKWLTAVGRHAASVLAELRLVSGRNFRGCRFRSLQELKACWRGT